MPTLIVENVPADVYELLKQRAEAGRRTLPEETLHLLKQQLLGEPSMPSPRLPDLIPNDAISVPFDLPRSSQPVSVSCTHGRPRLPDLPAEDRLIADGK